jgi:endonuclease/exonuclease/phosphatase family metal-dependent hydrolase
MPILFGITMLGTASIGGAAEIDVMTQNQYLGADLTPVVDAATAEPFDPAVFSQAVVQALTEIAATRPAERARALAAEIAQRKPDVVGLQEAFKFACSPYPGFPTQPGMGCDDPSIRAAFMDKLQSTEMALRGRYYMAGKVTNLNVTALPFMINGYPAVLTVADRDAILVRTGLSATAVDFVALGACAKPSDQGCNYQTAVPPFNTPLGPIAVERGFLAVDVVVGDRAYRVFNTHLEQRLLSPTLPATRMLQVGQAAELVTIALGTWDGQRSLIVVGDINSAPEDVIEAPYPPAPTPYQLFAGYGFTDAWTMRPNPGPGLTCCEAEDLTNRDSALYERIDIIFSFEKPQRVLNMKVLGATMGEKTRPPGNGGLWPADHAAVAAKLQFD